jgi:hypothetical protein
MLCLYFCFLYFPFLTMFVVNSYCFVVFFLHVVVRSVYFLFRWGMYSFCLLDLNCYVRVGGMNHV